MEKYQVVVIGGGATGAGIIRDLALRGISCALIEQEDLAHGTSSRFHGLLHSGARYAVKDKEAAKECIEENNILRKIAPNSIEETGGYFIQTIEDDPAYVHKWLKACEEAGIKTEEKDPQALSKANPYLSDKIVKAYQVPDATVDGFRIIWANVKSALSHGAKLYTYSKCTRIFQQNGSVTGVEITNKLTGEKKLISCDIVINAAGAWAGDVAGIAGLKVNVLKDKGTLLALNHRLFNQVINRLRVPGDGDIFVPHGTITILGTTSIPVNDASNTGVSREEVLKLLEIGSKLVPGIEKFRLIRAFAGVRPLYQAGANAAGREVSRNFALLDHKKSDGLSGFISIVGGKFTTFRLMAEKVVDLAAGELGVNKPCTTAAEPLIKTITDEEIRRGAKIFGIFAAKKAAERLGDNFLKVVEEAEKNPRQAEILCECELVSKAEIEYVAKDEYTHTLGDIRRKTRMGMGTCQGTFCSLRTIGVFSKNRKFTVSNKEYLMNFLQKRWKGIRPVLWGEQLREAQLAVSIYSSLFGMEKMK